MSIACQSLKIKCEDFGPKKQIKRRGGGRERKSKRERERLIERR